MLYLGIFVFFAAISYFLKRVNILLIPFFFINLLFVINSTGINITNSNIAGKEFAVPVLMGSIFFYFLGVLVDKKKCDIFLEILFQSLIIACVVFLGNISMKIYYIRNLAGGFYYFNETNAIFFTFFWIFININALKLTFKKGELFSGVGFCITLSILVISYKQNISMDIIRLGLIILSIYAWLLVYSFIFRIRIKDYSTFYFLSFLTVSLSILGTVKSVLIFSLIIPALIIGIPFMFILIMALYSYIRFNKGYKTKVAWNFSYKRLIFFLYSISFYITIIFLLYVSKINGRDFGIIAFLSLFVLFFIGRRIFFSNEKKESTWNIFGVNIHPMAKKDLLKNTEKMLSGNWQNFIVTLNSLMLYEVLEDDFYKVVLNSADVQIIDGIGVLWALDFLGCQNVDKITGIDYMDDILDLSSKLGKQVYFLGSQQEILENCVKNIKNKFPGIKVAGYTNGFFSKEDEEDIIERISRSGAEVLFVGMGVPKQEKWMFYNLHRLSNIKLAMGIGGAIDVYSGKINRAPRWVQDSGLEWLYRTIIEPKRLKRIFKLPIFVYNIIKVKIDSEK